MSEEGLQLDFRGRTSTDCYKGEGDVRGGTSADCYKEKVMSEEGLQLTATKRR